MQSASAEVRNMLVDTTTSFGDRVAKVMQATLGNPEARAMIEALDTEDDYSEQELSALETLLVGAGII
jgi:hypothetical protein